MGMVQRMVKTPHGLSLQRVHDHQRQHRQQDDHDREDRDHREHAGERAGLLLGHLAQRLAVAAHGAEEDDEVLHRAGRTPRRRRSRWCRGGSRTGRRAPVRPAGPAPAIAAKWWPNRTHRAGGHEVAPIGQPLGGGGAAVVEAEDAVGEEAAVEAVGDEVGADGGQHQPGGADRLAPVGGRACPSPPRRRGRPAASRALRA